MRSGGDQRPGRGFAAPKSRAVVPSDCNHPINLTSRLGLIKTKVLLYVGLKYTSQSLSDPHLVE